MFHQLMDRLKTRHTVTVHQINRAGKVIFERSDVKDENVRVRGKARCIHGLLLEYFLSSGWFDKLITCHDNCGEHVLPSDVWGFK